jgi:hypothetical protein
VPPPGPAAAPPAAAPAPVAAATPEIPPAPPTDDPVSGLMQTVGRTRAAIEDLRKVPDDFGRVLQGQKR